MPRFDDVVKRDYVPSPECVECFNDALSQLNRASQEAWNATHHTVEKSFMFFSWTSERVDQESYDANINNAKHTYQAALRACMRKFPTPE